MLTIVTQISATTLIASSIYAASQPFQISGEVEAGMGDVVGEMEGKEGRKYEPTQSEKYLATVWLIMESGLIYSSVATVHWQLVTYLLKMNVGVIMEFMLSRLSVRVFFFSFPLLIYILSSFSS